MVQLQEFRIVLPMTVEEFKRGMRYSNWKTNEQQTQEGQGGQLLSSSPFYDEQYGEGTFSHSVYRLGDRLPDWVTKLVPANALVIDEKTWATFPYLRTVMTCPFFSKLRIEVHSIHLDDNGSEPNALNLDPEELAQRKIDYVDILTDKVAKRDYRPDQDPGLVSSKLTGIGPLKPGWQKTASPTMCAYKVVKAYCGYWGVQNRAEKFICKGVRDIFLLTHRNCFCWLDLWYGLSFEQIVQLESFGRQKMKSAVKQPDIIDPKTGKPIAIEDDAASVASSQDAPRGKLRDRKGEEDRKAEKRRVRRDDSWESGSETGGPRSSVDDDSDTSDMEAEFYEALMEWGSPEDSEPESDMGLSIGLRNSFRLSVPPDSAPVPEDERCQVCAQGRGAVSRASFACETCGETFCAACFGEWHVTTKLRAHKRTTLKFKAPVTSAGLSSGRPSALAVGESQAELSTGGLVTASSVPIPIGPRNPPPLDRSASQPPAAVIKPPGDSGKPPIAAYGRSNSVGSRAVTEEYKDRGALVEEIERLKSNGADVTDVQVAETVLELYDFGRPRQTVPWLQEKTSAPLNTPVSEPASTSGRTSPRRSPSSQSLESLGAVSPAPRSPVQISQDMLRAIMTVYLAGGQHRQANGDPYGVRVNNAVDDIGAYKAAVELLTIKGEAGAMMESKAFLKFRILAELLIDAEVRDLSHEDRLAFWINVYNTLLLHAYLVNGLPKSHVKRISLMQRACYHIGGLVYSSLQIEHSILRAQSFRPALAGLLPVHRFKSGDPRAGTALTKPEPLVSFALSSGCRSGPALQVYSAESIAEQLETAARDFLRATVGFSRSKVLVPKIMHWYAKDFSTDAASLLDWLASKVTDNQAQAIRERLLRKKGHGSKCMDVQSYQWDFRYLFLQESHGKQ